MYWANFLHIYQPPTQKPHWIKRITAESYRKIFAALKQRPTAKLTLNINGVLVESLDACGEDDVLESIRDLLASGQLELTGSAKYHPLLPFLPDKEIIRQIELNEATLNHYFGSLYRAGGFFPPEMGFNKHVAEVVKKLGYKWIIVDELSFPNNRGQLRYDTIYQIDGLGDFLIFFRERRMSWAILSGQIGTGELLLKSLGERLTDPGFLLTAMDGETFGHHRPGLEQLLFEIYRSLLVKTVKISELVSLFSRRDTIEPLPSTWALMRKDLEEKKPFSRWRDPDNKIHAAQWQLTDLAIKTVDRSKTSDPNYTQARDMLDKAVHSDQYWWASARPWWSIEMVERGAKELYETVMVSPGAGQRDKEQAEELYYFIVFTAFDWQRSGLVDELARSEDEEVRQRADVGLPQLPQEEIDKMVAGLEKEMAAVVSRQEFERAAQLRDRIKELRSYAAEVEKPAIMEEHR